MRPAPHSPIRRRTPGRHTGRVAGRVAGRAAGLLIAAAAAGAWSAGALAQEPVWAGRDTAEGGVDACGSDQGDAVVSFTC
ncbi:MAG: hypothetical protein Q8K28_13975, partial [Hoeflea sp.]|uniref:hypothetical protein n=1 Tax=Hoeflea sp. TaxID=1940281 RepID=UPI002730404C